MRLLQEALRGAHAAKAFVGGQMRICEAVCFQVLRSGDGRLLPDTRSGIATCGHSPLSTTRLRCGQVLSPVELHAAKAFVEQEVSPLEHILQGKQKVAGTLRELD